MAVNDMASNSSLNARSVGSRSESGMLVAIPTMLQRDSLLDLLNSLDRSAQSAGMVVDVLLIDNSLGIEGASNQLPVHFNSIEVHRVRERRPGVVYARNLAVSYFRKSEHSTLAFLDDDEEVPDTWFLEVQRSLSRYPGSIVTGPVLYVVPDGVNDQYVEDYFSAPFTASDGEKLATTGTGNAIIPRTAFQQAEWPVFDLAFNRLGGEDTDFFQRLSSSGVDIIYCSGVYVHEKVDEERANRDWVRSRMRLSGMSRAKLEGTRLRAFSSGSARLAVGLVKLLFMTLRQRRRSAQAESMLFRGIGFLDYAFRSSAPPVYGRR